MPEISDKDGTKSGRLVSLGIIVLIILLGVGFIVVQRFKPKFQPIKHEGSMKITSSAFKSGQVIPKTYTCQDANVNPPLSISDVPDSSKSLALIMHDPDAPSGDFTHWLMWNIPISTTGVSTNSVPAGAMQGQNDFNKVGYGGPCPPSGTHHYYFDLYALDTKLDLSEQSQRLDTGQAIKGHILSQTSLIGLFSK